MGRAYNGSGGGKHALRVSTEGEGARGGRVWGTKGRCEDTRITFRARASD